MLKSKKLKTFLMTMSISFLSLQSVHAASYTVTSGDSLFTIGRLFNTAANTIMQNSNISNTTIYPGQVLNVPCKTYTVQKGDTLYLIAKASNVSLTSLRKANNKWDNYLYVGQKLNLPASSSVQVSPNNGQTSNSVISYTDAELDLLARLIKAEADGQPYSSKVAVAAVIVNRVQDSRFPKSITDVIYQIDAGYYQFTPVLNGMINKPATAEDRQAALEALKGADPTNGALYYFDDSTTNKWLWSKTVALRSGRMVFSYY